MDTNGTTTRLALNKSASEIEDFCRTKWGGKFVVMVGNNTCPLGSALTDGLSRNMVDFTIRNNLFRDTFYFIIIQVNETVDREEEEPTTSANAAQKAGGTHDPNYQTP
uniref:Uncharacterized protein n=1 Tax=Acrobeloides nanus TaxID=290746 RepID=A0A914CQY3_9BILA